MSAAGPVVEALARWRVPLGFACGIAALALAEPTPATLYAGGSIAVAGEAIRVWAAGHLEKSREVTTSGPYRYTRHPLYLGSAIMTLGFAIAANNLVVAAIAIVYLALTYSSAIRREEAFLTERFGAAYPDYRAGRLGGVARRFSVERALRNREYRAVFGLATALAILAFKAF
jgi:protein-S-isoprenylcysteine O-methyltransferase Ste14